LNKSLFSRRIDLKLFQVTIYSIYIDDGYITETEILCTLNMAAKDEAEADKIVKSKTDLPFTIKEI
jgi:hypothetical protein